MEEVFDSVVIMDCVPNIDNIENELRKELFHAVEGEFLDAFIGRLEGWWYRRAIQHLRKDKQSPILSEEIIAEETELREQFKRDNLPVDEEILSATVNDDAYLDRIFVEQLKLIDVNDKRIFFAIRDFFRAFEQRSRWLREELIQVGELERYERKLIEEWEIRYEQMCDEIGESAAEEEKRRKARQLYNDWC